MIIQIIKKGIILLWEKMWSPIHLEEEFTLNGPVIPLDKNEINKFDVLQDKYIGLLDGSNSANYINDLIIYDRTIRILKREDLLEDERLFLIDILEKFKIYIEK